jgi:hypothetical protein
MTMHMTMPNNRACLRLLILLLALLIRNYITHAQLALLSRTITHVSAHLPAPAQSRILQYCLFLLTFLLLLHVASYKCCVYVDSS